MSAATTELYTDIEDRWRWRVVSATGHVLADGTETFDDRSGVESRLSTLTDAISDARVIDVASGVHLFATDAGGWRLLDSQGRTVLSSASVPASVANEGIVDAVCRRVDSVGDDWPVEVSIDEADVEMTIDRPSEAPTTALTKFAEEAPIYEVADGIIVLHRGHDGEWRWHLRFGLAVVAESGEGYADREAALEAATTFKQSVPEAKTTTWG